MFGGYGYGLNVGLGIHTCCSRTRTCESRRPIGVSRPRLGGDLIEDIQCSFYDCGEGTPALLGVVRDYDNGVAFNCAGELTKRVNLGLGDAVARELVGVEDAPDTSPVFGVVAHLGAKA